MVSGEWWRISTGLTSHHSLITAHQPYHSPLTYSPLTHLPLNINSRHGSGGTSALQPKLQGESSKSEKMKTDCGPELYRSQILAPTADENQQIGERYRRRDDHCFPWQQMLYLSWTRHDFQAQ